MTEVTITTEPETPPPANNSDTGAIVAAVALAVEANVNAETLAEELEETQEAVEELASDLERTKDNGEWQEQRIFNLENKLAELQASMRPPLPMNSEQPTSDLETSMAEELPTNSTPPSTSEETSETPTEVILESADENLTAALPLGRPQGKVILV